MTLAPAIPSRAEYLAFKKNSTIILQGNPRNRIVESYAELNQGGKEDRSEEILFARLAPGGDSWVTPHVMDKSRGIGAFVGPIDLGRDMNGKRGREGLGLSLWELGS